MSLTVCPVNPPGHDWENGLTCRWCNATRTVTEAILSQLSSRRGGTPADAQKLLDAYRAEVLAERDTQFVAWLLKRSREDEHGDVIARLASKVARGAIRPNNLRTDFFQPGHSYTHRNGHDFRCVAVTTHPVTGEELAVGWHVDSWGVHFPAAVGINQWRHEYDGVEPPAENGEVTR